VKSQDESHRESAFLIVSTHPEMFTPLPTMQVKNFLVLGLNDHSLKVSVYAIKGN
jgi:hypothetical protein